MRKSNGTKIEPCGTPTRTGAQSECWPLRTILWCLYEISLMSIGNYEIDLEGFLIF